MAEVWEGRDDVLDRSVAIKTLHPHLARDPGFVARFAREARSAAKLNHPSIVAVFDTGIDQPQPDSTDPQRAYIIMELVTGRSLRAILNTALSLETAVNIAAQTADGLHYAHSQGVVHRDVKPANILVQADGRVKVTDFGIAKAIQSDANLEDLTQAGAILGTAKYLSPEQVDGVGIDARADIYSLGVVLYEMICGKPPFVAATDLATALMHVQATAPRPRQMRPGIPRPLDDVIVRAMNREPSGRFSSAAEMAQALRSIDMRADDAVPAVKRGPADITPPNGIDRPPARPPFRPPVVGQPDPAYDPTTITSSPDATRVQRSSTGRSVDSRPDFTTTRQRDNPVLDNYSPSRTGSTFAIAVLGVVGLLGGLAIGYLANRSSTGAIVGSRAAIQAVVAIDPYGDREENDELTRAVFDSTNAAWTTESYKRLSTDMGPKPGVGIGLQMASSERIKQVVIVSPTVGWDVEIYILPTENMDKRRWGSPAATRVEIDQRTTIVDVGGSSGQFVIVWITRIGDARQVELTEVSVQV
jgi:eukaryotic-like serine/threonine-protein kinase